MEMSETNNESSKSNMSSKIIVGLVILLLVGGVYAFTREDSSTMTKSKPTPTVMEKNLDNGEEPIVRENIEGMGEKVAEISMNGVNFSFDPNTITVKKGTKVRLTLTNTDSSEEWEIKHDFVIDELDVASEVVEEGESTTVEFIADSVGEFEYYCSIGEHRDMGMVGTLVVTE